MIKNLTVHLIPALKRLSLGLTIRNPYTSKIKKYFTRAYNEAVDLGIKIKNAYGIFLNDDELAYIALHIEAFNKRNNKVMTVALVCSTGLGTARLLEQRIKKQFSNQIKISRVVSVQEIKEKPVSEDLVISTINIKLPNVPLIVVSPFLDENGIRKINGVISKFNNGKAKPEAFMSLINPKYIFLNDKKITRNRVIKKLTDALYKDGFVRTGIGQAAIKREEMASIQQSI
ncbi:putative transcriptional antiterminator [Lactobacillus acetotolerans]|uniref:Putative transcriptional antiterminator n=1 Tax=Lactobacillus acetotolerans TaxID=1600 RepID=A0A0D6A407_9LACO|nr:PRD domain-containing protein [Lactobacillus acetotolerans]BAQ57175.1 putative transcriptional antiterminator [Lactobacillus acetotolerans]